MLSIKNKQWRNWAETTACHVEHVYEPKSIEEVQEIVKQHQKTGKKIRVVGAGHSFTPLVATTSSLLSLDYMQGILHVNTEEDIVTVYGGTRLKNLGPLLHEQKYAMENLGDINEQSLAGAISTGTHGTGIRFGSLSTQVVGMTIVTSDGELMEVSERKNKNYFKAMQTSLGLLGIIVKVDLQVEPSFRLKAKSIKTNLNTCLMQLDVLKEENRHFEFYYFPYTDTVQIKTANEAEESNGKTYKPSYVKDILIENSLFKVMSETSRMIPNTSRFISKLAAVGVPTGEKTGDSFDVFTTPRLVKFTEMEYSIPTNKMKEVILEIKTVIEQEKFDVHFPIECRYVKGDSIWLSPAYGRDSAFVAVHMYKGMEHEPYFEAVERILMRHAGRAHWGKMHMMDYDQLQAAYPKLNAFLQVREILDPEQMFVNSYLATLFHLKNKSD